MPGARLHRPSAVRACDEPGPVRAALQFVPHSGADLYRALVHLVRQHAGALPRVSLDTIEASIVNEAYEDLGLEPPTHVLSLEMGRRPHHPGHRGHHRVPPRTLPGRRRRRLRDLPRRGIRHARRRPGACAFRIAHTRAVLRDSLRQAHLAARLAITEATQPAAVLVRLGGATNGTRLDPGSYDAQRRRLLARMAVVELAEALQGRMAELDDETLIVYSNRATIEAALARLAADRSGPLAVTSRRSEGRMGIGLGATVPAAEENARRALVMGERDGDLHVALPDGQVLLATADHARVGTGSVRRTSPRSDRGTAWARTPGVRPARPCLAAARRHVGDSHRPGARVRHRTTVGPEVDDDAGASRHRDPNGGPGRSGRGTATDGVPDRRVDADALARPIRISSQRP